MSRQFKSEGFSFQPMVLEQLDSHMQKMNLRVLPNNIPKINSKLIKKPNKRAITTFFKKKGEL